MEDLVWDSLGRDVWDSLGRDSLSVKISRDKQQDLYVCGQKYLSIPHLLPGQNEFNLQSTK